MGVFPHLPTISVQSNGNQKCWEEQINVTRERSYAEATQPVNPPDSESFAKANTPPRHGISIITVNADSSLAATRSDTWPTTVWIWSLTTGRLVAALIHHSPVKHIEWHPSINDLLLIQCTVSEPVAHMWKKAWDTPRIFSLALERAAVAGRLGASWLEQPSSDVVNIMLSSSHRHATAQISATDGSTVVPIASSLAEPEAAALSMGTGPEDMFDEGHSLDFSPVKISNGNVDLGGGYDEGGFGMTGEIVDDTFHYRRNVKAGG